MLLPQSFIFQEPFQDLQTARRLSLDFSSRSLRTAIVQTVAYADVFDYPLTAREIRRYLIRVPASQAEVDAALLEGSLVPRYLSFHHGFYTLPGREAIVLLRRRRALAAASLWPPAVRYGKRIARLPFVRMVAVTGALAVDNVDRGADLDYMILTKPGRLWLCRAFVILLVRWAALRGVRVCPNYFLSTNALAFPDRSLYTAHELVQMVPLSGGSVYRRLMRVNTWTAGYLPNAISPPANSDISHGVHPPDPIRDSIEAVLSLPAWQPLERWEMDRKIRRFNQQPAPYGEADFCADWCKGHFDGHARRTLAAYAHRLQAIDLPPG